MNGSRELGATIEGASRPKAAVAYMAVFTDIEGHETVIEIRVTENGRLPLVAIDQAGLAILRQFSQQTADKTGQTVSIICFTGRQLYESYSPSATGD